MNIPRRRELLLSLKYSTIEACFSVPMLNLTTGNLPFVIGFAVKVLGWNPTAIGLMAATPQLCNFLQPPLTNLLQKRFSLYEIMIVGFLMNALPWALVSTLPWLGEKLHLAFALIVFISSLANSVCSVAWSAAICEVVPLSIRGRYFGKRNVIYGFWTLVIVLAAGWTVDSAHSSLQIFGIVFTLAATMRLIGLYFLTRMQFPEIVMERRTETARFRDYVAVFRDRNYLVLLAFSGLWGFCINLGGPFYSVFVLRELPFTVGDLTVLTVMASFGGLISFKTWGLLSDRFGNKPVLFMSAIIWAGTAMGAWFFASPGFYHHLYLNYFITGFMTAGFQLSQFNLMIKLVPAGTKAHYISVFFAFTSLFSAFGPVIGGEILNRLPHQVGSFLGRPLLSYHFLLMGSLFLCFLTVHILQLLREPEERPIGELVQVMGKMQEFNPIVGLALLAQFVFTPRAIIRLARESVRSFRKQTGAMTEVGEELVSESWRALKERFERHPPAGKR